MRWMPRRTFDIALKLIGTKAREKDQALVIAVEEKCAPFMPTSAH